jgi:hypothetical protein
MCHSESREELAPSVPATLTSKGLRVQLSLCWNTGFKPDRKGCLALLDCKVGDDSLARVAIPLICLPSSRDQFRRSESNWLLVLSPGHEGPRSASAVGYSEGMRFDLARKRCF